MFLKHDSGEAAELRNQQILGDDSPLEFDENGYAEVDGAVGKKLLAMHRHIERGGHGPPNTDDEADVANLDGESGPLPLNPEEHTNDDIGELVAEIDDEATLVALRNLEEEQKDRDGAKDAITNRIEELED